ncbi:sugar transferase [Thioclava sp. SK-1]|uniref:sugar transferase n=1 Tax=Thioclava sp. SK-1 TaxID=1889770 RepID=UPI000826D2C5|nr:sugar transferase [Thioclava sp. SK-1]OCX64656.1 sugar transferase [Thioclava sp. SK-1]
MTLSKRLFDLTLALILSPILLTLMLVVLVTLMFTEGRPYFYAADRMRSPTRRFRLWKFRTMTIDHSDHGVTGGNKAARITRIGRILRKTRGDELPQLWNIFKGDLSFVGPRAPLPDYVERFPEIYGQVLQSRPGATGIASLYYHRHEEWLLAKTTTPAETDAVYCQVCIPAKAKLDLLYQRHQSVCFDLVLVVRTIKRVLS